MTVNPVAASRPIAPSGQPAQPGAATDIAARFAVAVRQKAVPLPAPLPASLPASAGVTIPLPPRLSPAPHGTVPAVTELTRRLRQDPEMPDLALVAGTLAAPAGPAAVAPPAAAVDPSAFADLMNQLWLREQHKTTREVRVRFGDAAWPATGARLIRLDDGSLDIEVSIGRHAQGGDLDALRRQFAARGLPVGSVIVAEDD